MNLNQIRDRAQQNSGSLNEINMELTKRTFSWFILVTFALLMYVHQQISIFQVSYSIQRKEREAAKLSEEYKMAKFRLDRLRSPHVLNQRMKEMSLDLTTPTEQEVIRILKPKIAPQETKVSWPDPVQFLSTFHFMKEAQAKTSSRE